MVYAFIIHTLLPGTCRVLYSSVFGVDGGCGDEESVDYVYPRPGAGSETTSMSDVTLPDHGDDSAGDAGRDPGSTPADRLRRSHKRYILQVAQEAHSEYAFRTKTTNRSYERDLVTLQNESTLPEFELGFFRAPSLRDPVEEDDGRPGSAAGDPGAGGRAAGGPTPGHVVVWMGALNCGFILICKKHENRMMAESVLKLLIKYLVERVRLLTHPQEVLLRPDRVTRVVRQFLPAGRLLPMNHRVIRQFEKELEAKLNY